MEYENQYIDSSSVPPRTHRHSRQRSNRGSTSSRHQSQNSGPDVISNLISSLSVISQPATDHFESQPAVGTVLDASPQPAQGSFGVDYGAYNKPAPFDNPIRNVNNLDDLSATSPVVRTNNRSSFGSISKSPRGPHDGPLRPFPRSSAASSRPSSRGSDDDDANSIGNLSVEPGTAPELRHRKSLDSWGRKPSRTGKSVLYMPSMERLRDRESDKRWTSGSGDYSVRGDLLSEAPISEDQPYQVDGPQKVPTRDSSLRKGHKKKRSSVRRSTADDAAVPAAIAESVGEYEGSRVSNYKSEAGSRRFHSVDKYKSVDGKAWAGLGDLGDEARIARAYSEDYDEESAPSPAISSGRKQWERLPKQAGHSRRTSGHLTPHAERSRAASSESRPLPAGYDRPVSPDSVDDAVESYLCSPRLSQKIKHPQTGRVISFSEVGDPEGSAVFCCVGMGLTRYITAFYDELALTLKLRLITPDRPGVGDSEAYSDGTATPLNWPDDVYTICQALKITKFSILAHSAGAIYALATALRMPQHIRGKIHLLAPWIPPSQMNTFGSMQNEPPSHSMPTSQRILRALPTSFLKAANSSFMSATSASLTSSLPKDKKRTKRKASGQQKNGAEPEVMDAPNLTVPNGGPGVPTSPNLGNMDRMQPPQGTINPDGVLALTGDAEIDKERQQTYDTRLTYAIWDLATTGANPAVDLLVCLERRHAIGFRYVDITRPVVIHHGSKDSRVPVENVKWLGKTMRRCEVRVLEDEGHGLMASATVMGSVLMEMSKEWDDWMRVTGADGRRDKDKERARKMIPV